MIFLYVVSYEFQFQRQLVSSLTTKKKINNNRGEGKALLKPASFVCSLKANKKHIKHTFKKKKTYKTKTLLYLFVCFLLYKL